MSWREQHDAPHPVAHFAMGCVVLALSAWCMCGCDTQPDMPPAVGAVPAVERNASFTAAHVIRAQTILESIQKTPAAELALSHLRIAIASLPTPSLADRKRAEDYRIEEEPVQLTAAAGLLTASRDSLSDHVAAAERKARQDEFQQGEARRAASLLLVSSTVIGGLAVASGVAYLWIRLKSLIGTALLLGAVSAVLLLGARLVANQWLMHVLFAAFAVALVCVGVVVWRAWLAQSPLANDKRPMPMQQ